MADRIGNYRGGAGGRLLGNYRLLQPLGRGGFADVYLGEHVQLKTLAAVKVLRMQIANGELDSFLKEAHTIARLEHPHIIHILEYNVQDHTPFLVMQYAPNGTLRERHPKGAILTPGSILPYVRQVASALQYAHDQKLIHRDIKPENMLLGQQNQVLLSDFGLAIITQSSSYQQTLQGIDGTLAYMAPEQSQGKPRPASDQYALGIVIYEWLTGSRPFTGTLQEIQAQHMQATPQRLCGRGLEISPAVEQVVLTALLKDPHQRFASVQDFATSFEAACSDKPTIVTRSYWNVPHRHNTYFTGREEILQRLYDALRKNKATALTQAQAITGLGGIGKTQVAVEYAHRYRHDYRTVLWVKADSPDLLHSDFSNLADLLNLPEKNEPDQSHALNAVKRWLEMNTSWLLIFDNVADPQMLNDFFPMTDSGHIMLTTRAQITDTHIQGIELEKMELDESVLFLLRRARIIQPDGLLIDTHDTERATAREISTALDGFPLALDQAGAYIEGTECGLSGYLQLYQTRHTELLQERGKFVPRHDHPESVATTLSLSFEQVLQASPAAADLLYLCAFLHPDAIPEEILTDGARDLGRTLRPILTDQVKLDTAIGELRRYSLVRRNPDDHTLTIHRLVQAILKYRMNKSMQRRWAVRAVRAVNRTFPEVEFRTWQRCQRCLPHAKVCAELVKQWDLTSLEAGRLLDHVGHYLRERAQYTQAEPLLTQALAIRERIVGSGHPEVALSLNALALTYYFQSKYTQAERLYQRALNIREQTLGLEHSAVAESLDGLAKVYLNQGKYLQAESLCKRALAIREQILGPDHPDIADSLSNLALLYFYQGKDIEAESLYQRTLSIRERALGPEHPDVADSLNNLALLYYHQGKYTQTEAFYQRALLIREQILGPEHPDVADSLNSLAGLYRKQGKYTQAEPLYQRALVIYKQVLGPDHPSVGQIFTNLALLYYHQGKYIQAEPLYQQGLTIKEQALGSEHPAVASSLHNFASLLLEQGKYTQAEPLYQRALALYKQLSGPEHPNVASALNDLATLYYKQGKYTSAELLYKQALTIYEQIPEQETPDIALSLNNLVTLYTAQGKHNQAESLCKRALSIREKTLGPDHPDVAQSLKTLAEICSKQGLHHEAEQLCTRALETYEQALGSQHLYVAQSLNTLAEIYQAQGNYAKAKPLYQRALNILEKTLGPSHPDIARCFNGLAELSYAQGRYTKAEKYCMRAIEIYEQTLGLTHPALAQNLTTLVKAYFAQGKYDKAEPLYQRALAIREQVLATEHLETVQSLADYAVLLRKIGREDEAVELEKRGKKV